MKKNESKQRKLTKKMKIKLAGVFGCSLLALVGLLVGITWINAKSGNKYTQQVLTQSQQQYTDTRVPFRRGSITDRNGTMLANSVKVYNLILDCVEINNNEKYKDPTKVALEEYFDIEQDVVDGLLTNEETKGSRYQILKKEVTMDERRAFEESLEVPESKEERETLGEEEITRRQRVKGIYFEDTYKRIYPLGSLACDVIGFTDAGDTATWGLEGYYNSTLNGTNGRTFGYLSDDSSLEQNIIDPVNGKNLTTTLDATIQEIVEKYISAFDRALSAGPNNKKNVKKRGAENIAVIIQNPNNGEILAMASSGTYDLNNPRDLSGSYTEYEIENMDNEETKEALFDMWKNYCVSQNFEPGSTFKPVVVASALESGAITEENRFICDGGEEVGVDYVRCAVYPDSHGSQSLGEVIQNSCNDGMMAIGRKMGTNLFLEYQRKFNFGTRTGIDLPSEETGLLFSEDNMYEMELSTSAFGQGFNCTMIQEISAISAAINGGTYYQPHLVKEITDEDGKTVKNVNPNVLKQPISEEVSAKIREYMGLSVTNGTSRAAKVQGYSMGGKTGTAEKLNEKEKGNYLVSFIGFAPLDKPEMVIYTVVDTPNVEKQASSSYAQYLAQAIMSEVLPYMNIYQDEPTTEETVLWQGFYGVPKMTDIVEDGVSNPYGTILDQGYGDGDPIEEEDLNDQNTDGITNEDAGIEEEDPEYEDTYDLDELEDDIRR
ncbi:MAG: penicillin-binding transpeptidase domain-containing protein [Blautia sp.]|uniref:peptidoglycan D,D-transpeptidase FtsI family protein n=1 Tax=Blautia sp. TaxID=1955243 RepID=UPI002E79EC62|nr:penicillin-binding transpeptidase domain-containing protein [Blautia sp.]MEE1442086.1 penicillin-binding transpeptidase domain-containing protein [Blautia sp.]